ncbi:hypothetical protein [Nocardiopsis trehalosi]|uniref:hypothetical protein n=1 Tax=Nocardiopsis trehalosi TaxID=109329 RepID=UPI00082BA717|nr:hypothetical protein [Nocardiopsis trehalosi]
MAVSSPPLPRALPAAWQWRLRVLTAACSAVFAVGTLLQNVVVVDLAMLEHAMRLAGMGPAEAAAAAPGFLDTFRAVGWLFVAGNAVGVLAVLPGGGRGVFWTAVAVNAAQAVGVAAVPAEVFRASLDLYGPAGVLPTLVTDGGALVLVLLLLGAFAVSRAPWGGR